MEQGKYTVQSCPSLHKIPGGVWAHLGDQKSGYLVQEGAPGSFWASN